MKPILDAAGTAAVSNTMAWMGEKSYFLEATLDADIAKIAKWVTAPASEGYVGLDFYFSITDGDYNNFTRIILSLNYNKISSKYDSGVYLTATGLTSGLEIKLLNSAGGYTVLPVSFPLNSDNDDYYFFHHIKYVIDIQKKSYYYMIIDNKFYDLRGNAMYLQAATASEYIQAVISLYGKTAGAATGIYVDQIAITDQEEIPQYPEQYLKQVEM